MRRSSALLATAALTAGLLTVPATAHADVTDIKVTTAFDRLDPERVATVTLTAKSVSGITDVRGNVRSPSRPDGAYATLRFERVAGTDNDGTWEARFHADTDAHAGGNAVDVLITSADGATVEGHTGFLDCYVTSMTDVTTGPDVIDADHPIVTTSGRVMMQKSHDDAPVPVPGVLVKGHTDDTTGPDGAFSVTSDARNTLYVQMPTQGTLCATATYGHMPAIAKQATQISARITTPQPVAVGTEVSVEGTVLRNGAAGPVPAADAPVNIYRDYGTTGQRLLSVGYATEDGAFNVASTPDTSGPLTAVVPDTAFLTGGQASAGAVDVRKAVQFIDVHAYPQPGKYGGFVDLKGSLVGNEYGATYGVVHEPIVLEFSTDRTTWSRAATGETFSDGTFSIGTQNVRKDGYWRVRFPGTAEYMPAMTGTSYIDIKYATKWDNFNASPEPVKKGAAITVKGQLYRSRDVSGPGPHAPVFVYFDPKGAAGWRQVASGQTDGNGWFTKTFKASEDGTWKLVYKETSGYLGSTSTLDYVDVR